jgi:DNA-binding PadR family transcriptional regulator
MMRATPVPVLGEFELLVVLAVLQLGDSAYPLAVAEEIERTSDRKASRPAVLITLDRLEEKGLLTSRYGDPTPVRGGRSRRVFLPRPLAVRAARESIRRIKALSKGLEGLPELS